MDFFISSISSVIWESDGLSADPVFFALLRDLPEDEFPREFDILATREFANDEDKDIDEGVVGFVGIMGFVGPEGRDDVVLEEPPPPPPGEAQLESIKEMIIK